uniref:FERM domain-containing protein n=1 Tax=Trichobilharzia regenti TaxID=157069 RepID=A0AA85KFN6_TRIRE|nr:unnamed protein product [Trichobilharzia regenti]
MTLKFSGTYNVEAAEQVDRSVYQNSITCNIWLLDSTAVAFRVDKRCIGQALLDLTFDYLELLERDFFGLVFTIFESEEGNLIKWLDPTRRIKKQCKGVTNYTFWFRVKFYVPDPVWLQEEYTRYQFFLQVRKDILDGRLPVSRSISTQLAGLALQSELGDYSPEECRPGYVNQFRFVQNQNSEFETQASEWHRKSSSLLPAAAELEYLNVARYLDHYGVKSHVVKDEQHDLQTVTIGVSFIGISLFRENKLLQQYSWDNIAKIIFKGKKFTLHLKTPNKSMNGHLSSISGLSTSPIMKSESELKQHYRFKSAVSTKLFWQYAVSCHAFFRVREPINTTTTNRSQQHQQQQQQQQHQQPPSSPTSSTISATALYAAMSRVASGFQRYFSITRRSSLSTATPNGPVGGVGRTLSTLMELRKSSRAFDRSFARLHSRRSNHLSQISPTNNPVQNLPPLCKPDASTISPTTNLSDSNTTGNQSKSYAQIPPPGGGGGGMKNSTSVNTGMPRSSHRSALVQNRDSNNTSLANTSASASGKIKKLISLADVESSTNISRLSSQTKQTSNEVSSQKTSVNNSSSVLDKSSRLKPHKPSSPVASGDRASRLSQRRHHHSQQQQQQHQEMVSTNHSHHNNISNDAKTSSRRSQKVSVNENIDYADVDFVDSVDTINSNANNNTSNTNCSSKDFDKDDTASYWSTRRMQRLHSHSILSVGVPTTSAVTTTMTTSSSNPSASIKTHSNSNVNKVVDELDGDHLHHNRAPANTTTATTTNTTNTIVPTTSRRSRYLPTEHCINTTSSAAMTTTSNDSNVNDDMHGHKSLRTTLNYSVNRLNTSSRSQLNLANKGYEQKKEHSDIPINYDNDGNNNLQHTRSNKIPPKDQFHPGAPDSENAIPSASEVNEFNAEGLVRITIRPDSHGRFGFNVKGGIDHGMPVIVSRVGTNMPADLCIPRLSEGDQILYINNKDVSNQTHMQVVNMIRAASEQSHGSTLELLVKPSGKCHFFIHFEIHLKV